MRNVDNDRVAWSSTTLQKRKPKEKEWWFRKIVVGLQEDAKALSEEVKVRIHKAATVVAMAIGGGWPNFRQAVAVVKATVVATQVVGERLTELFTMCYLKPGTDRPMIDHRGDVILAVEKLVGPMLEGDVRSYIVTTHQRRYVASAAFLREHGISARQPMLISMEERQELRALMYAAKWGEAEGYFEKSWTVREDGSLEVGLHPAGSSRVGDVSGVVLYQYHTEKVDDIGRERWISVIENQRTARATEVISYQIQETYDLPKGGKRVLRAYDWNSTFETNDPQDRRDDSDGHPGYYGLVPLGSPTLVENQLQTRRVRARMGWEVRAYEKKGDGFVRVSKDKEILCNDGRIWKPEDAEGNPEQDFFADPRQVLSWKDKETERWITIKRWNKLVMQKSMFEFMVPKGPNEQGFELYDHVRGRDISSDEAIGYLHDKSVIVSRDSTFRRELEGVFLSAVENMAYAKIAFFEKDRGFGSPAYPLILSAVEVPVLDKDGAPVMRDGVEATKTVKIGVPCKRCDSKWGSVADAMKAQWTEMPHAYICNSCGSEVWKVGVRVFVDAKYFPFVIRRDKRVTHFSAEFFGPWVRELLDNTVRDRARRARVEAAKLPTLPE